MRLPGWVTGDEPSQTFDEELAKALRYCTTRTFATLPDDQQVDGIRRLARALEIYADEFEEGVL